jgi:hypothetical protein
MSGLKWTRKTTEKIALELESVGINVCPRTVARLLRNMDYSLRVNQKKRARVPKISPEDRNAQFVSIAQLREHFAACGLPVISVDTKKKELVGCFKNAGASWGRSPVEVNDHDFPSDSVGKAIPYGIYDIKFNCGTVYVGTSHDTAEFAVDSIASWWQNEAQQRYPGVKELAILADGGGSNGSRCRAWKLYLQRELAARYGIKVTVAHYPPGTSKWNLIEHRLFSEISKNWAGRPLDTWETLINYIRTTRTSTGLTVQAHLVEREYSTGIEISDDEMSELPIIRGSTLPLWNYTICPN